MKTRAGVAKLSKYSWKEMFLRGNDFEGKKGKKKESSLSLQFSLSIKTPLSLLFLLQLQVRLSFFLILCSIIDSLLISFNSWITITVKKKEISYNKNR
jgi:hypothetical protein